MEPIRDIIAREGVVTWAEVAADLKRMGTANADLEAATNALAEVMRRHESTE